MVTQCEAQGKKKKSVTLYAGIFDSKSFRRGGKAGPCESRPLYLDDPPASERSRPSCAANCFQSLDTEDAPSNNHANMRHKSDFVPSDDIASQRTLHPHVNNAGVYANLRKDTYKDKLQLRTVPNLGAVELEERNSHHHVIEEHINAIEWFSNKSSIQLDVASGRRSLMCDAGSDRNGYTDRHNNAGHQCHETRALLSARSNESSESKILQGNRPLLPQHVEQSSGESADNVGGLVVTNLDHYSAPSALPGKLCSKNVELRKMEDQCTSADTLLQLGKTSSTSIQAAEWLSARSCASVDEICRLESGLSFPAVNNEHASSGQGDVSVSGSFSFKSNVNVVASAMVSGSQCGTMIESMNLGSPKESNWCDGALPVQKVIPKQSKGNLCNNGLGDAALKSDVIENGRHLTESSVSQALHPDKTRNCGDMIYPDIIKASKSGEQELHVRRDANGFAWKESPSRGHPVLTSPTRIGETISLDSLSSHGGSSSSGSPLASEALKEGRVSSPGDISMSKGSPYSVSSRSMGSITAYENSVNALLSPTSSNESSGQHWQWNARRSDEMILGTTRSAHSGNSQRTKAGGMSNTYTTSGNLTRGRQSANCNDHGNLLNGGSLLVGGANGDVLSYSGVTKGNIKLERTRQSTFPVDCRLLKKALASSDSEEIRNAGNEYYKAGHFLEALALYDKAVALCPSNVLYRLNRAAALSGLERLGEAVKECREAIRLVPSCARAHQHIASLYIRLGMIETAKQHLGAAGQHTALIEVQQLQIIEKHLSRCIESRKLEDWQNVIKESDAAVVAGADSAPQIFCFKAEALLRLQKLQQADSVCNVAQKIERSLMNLSIGSPNPSLHLIKAQINIALGRFDEAIQAAEAGASIDSNNTVATVLLRKARTVAQARATGNELFKAGRLFEALASYAEGLESDPTNAVLLSNRAACRLKLGHWEKAVEDCDAALRVQPNYSKALLRRANCLTKLERWEDALQDYEALKRDFPGDADVERALFDVQVAMKKSRGEETRGMKFGGDVEEVTNEERFREAVGSPGLSVVQFITRWSDRCQELSPFIDDLCRRHPCVNFVKVDVEELPFLARIESITFIPTFKIYKDGQKLKEIVGPSEQSLEYAVRHYSR